MADIDNSAREILKRLGIDDEDDDDDEGDDGDEDDDGGPDMDTFIDYTGTNGE